MPRSKLTNLCMGIRVRWKTCNICIIYSLCSDCTAVVYSSDTEMINYSVIRSECTFIIFDHVLLEKERVFVNLSTINCSLLRKQVASDWFCVENWFLMVQLLGNSFLPGLLKAPDKPLSIRSIQCLTYLSLSFSISDTCSPCIEHWRAVKQYW